MRNQPWPGGCCNRHHSSAGSHRRKLLLLLQLALHPRAVPLSPRETTQMSAARQHHLAPDPCHIELTHDSTAESILDAGCDRTPENGAVVPNQLAIYDGALL